jgi:GTP-binding protein
MDLLNWLKHYGIHTIPVLTKADKVSRQQAQNQRHRVAQQIKVFLPSGPILFSAKTRQGREEIWKEIDKACKDRVVKR